MQNSSNTAVRHDEFYAPHNIMERRSRPRMAVENEVVTTMPLVVPEQGIQSSYQAIKRMVDIVLSAAALVTLMPAFGIIALFIKLSSQGPVLFSQTRVGLGGRYFKMYKFRTMVQHAEKMKTALLEKNEHKSGPVFKIEKDPRITWIGGFLRKFSIDEFPQFWNVLVGDMTLVGPRPPLPEEVAQYRYWQTRRLAAKPGLTCIWQVSGRNQIGFEEWMRMDLRYIQFRSLRMDLGLILRTVKVVISGKGAS